MNFDYTSILRIVTLYNIKKKKKKDPKIKSKPKIQYK